MQMESVHETHQCKARFPSNVIHAKIARHYATDTADLSDATAKAQGWKRCL